MTELLKSDSICQSYAQMKKGPVFWLTVYIYATLKSIDYNVAMTFILNNNNNNNIEVISLIYVISQTRDTWRCASTPFRNFEHSVS